MFFQLPLSDFALPPKNPGPGDPVLRGRAEHRPGLQEPQTSRPRLRLLRPRHPLHHLLPVRISGSPLAPRPELQRLDVSGAEQVFEASRARAHPRGEHHSLRPQVYRLVGQTWKAAPVLRQQHRSQRFSRIFFQRFNEESSLRQPVGVQGRRRQRRKFDSKELSENQGSHSPKEGCPTGRCLHRIRTFRQKCSSLHHPGVWEARVGGCGGSKA